MKSLRFSSGFPLTFLQNSGKLIPVVKPYNFTEEGAALKNQTYRMTMLYDFYGELLTDIRGTGGTGGTVLCEGCIRTVCE